jgi:hypothetical protein
MKKLWFFLFVAFLVPRVGAEVTTENGYVVEASFISTAPVQIIWAVLTDYDHIAEFVPTIVESKFTPPDRLHQEVRGHYWFIHKTVNLDLKIKETPYNKIEFETVTSSDDFKVYNGAWELKSDNVVRISYTLIAEPNFFVPKQMLSEILTKETKIYIDSIQEEINMRYRILSGQEN